jgi:prevent-host-death family protein
MKTKAKSAKTRVKVKAVPSGEIKTTRTRTIPAGEFKAKCLAIIDEVHDRHEQVIITKYGKPMARLAPLQQPDDKPESIFGFMRGKMRIVGDIVSPLDPLEAWDSEK